MKPLGGRMAGIDPGQGSPQVLGPTGWCSGWASSGAAGAENSDLSAIDYLLQVPRHPTIPPRTRTKVACNHETAPSARICTDDVSRGFVAVGIDLVATGIDVVSR